jgi:hypothetical protein
MSETMNDELRELVARIEHEVHNDTGECRRWCLRCQFNRALAEKRMSKRISIDELEKLYGASKTCFDPGHNLFWQNFTKAVNDYFATPNRAERPQVRSFFWQHNIVVWQKPASWRCHCGRWALDSKFNDEGIMRKSWAEHCVEEFALLTGEPSAQDFFKACDDALDEYEGK